MKPRVWLLSRAQCQAALAAAALAGFVAGTAVTLPITYTALRQRNEALQQTRDVLAIAEQQQTCAEAAAESRDLWWQQMRASRLVTAEERAAAQR